MIDRRTFLKTGVIPAASATALLGSGEALSAEETESRGRAPKGQAQVPDTLELAYHRSLGINGILGSLNPNLDYETIFLNILDVHPAYMLYWSSMVSGVQPKYVEALPMLRQMSGSKQDLDLEKG